MRHVALLRGINVGKHNRVKMADLREALTSAGLVEVTTYLQSGNVLFDSEPHRRAELESQIGDVLSRMSLPRTHAIRSGEEMARLVAVDPFQGIEDVPEGHLFVAFLGFPCGDLPRFSRRGDLEVVHQSELEVCVAFRPVDARPANFGELFDRASLATLTTRNWAVTRELSRQCQP